MKQKSKSFYLFTTALLGAIAIGLGAFGAHSLKEVLTADQLDSFETAVRYQMYHVIVLLIVLTGALLSSKVKKIISLLFILGILLFSGSIYAITFGIPAEFIWFITPIGGLMFIVGWVLLAIHFLKSKAAHWKNDMK